VIVVLEMLASAALAVVAPKAMPPSRVAAAATPAKSFLNFMRNPLFLIVIDFLAIAEAATPQRGLRDPQILIVFFGEGSLH
jgi:hypothetical protein